MDPCLAEVPVPDHVSASAVLAVNEAGEVAGVRLFGELTELRRKDIDVRHGVIRVRRAVTWPGTLSAERTAWCFTTPTVTTCTTTVCTRFTSPHGPPQDERTFDGTTFATPVRRLLLTPGPPPANSWGIANGRPYRVSVMGGWGTPQPHRSQIAYA